MGSFAMAPVLRKSSVAGSLSVDTHQ